MVTGVGGGGGARAPMVTGFVESVVTGVYGVSGNWCLWGQW